VRVHELAKELGVTSKELLVTLEQMGATGRSASSSVPEDLVPRLRASGGKAVGTASPKRREVLEPPPAPRKARPKAAPKAAKTAIPPEPDGDGAAPSTPSAVDGANGAPAGAGVAVAPVGGPAPAMRSPAAEAPT